MRRSNSMIPHWILWLPERRYKGWRDIEWRKMAQKKISVISGKKRIDPVGGSKRSSAPPKKSFRSSEMHFLKPCQMGVPPKGTWSKQLELYLVIKPPNRPPYWLGPAEQDEVWVRFKTYQTKFILLWSISFVSPSPPPKKPTIYVG